MEKLVSQLAGILKDYRSDERLNPTPQIIEKWISQFTPQNQQVILKEMIHIFNKMYVSEQKIDKFLLRLITNKKLTNNNPKLFWSDVSLLNIQKDGQSQNIMVEKFKKLLWQDLEINIAINDYSKSHYIYLDDFLFSGMKLKTDLTTFMQDAPYNAKIDIIYIGYFASGKYYVKNKWLKNNNSKNLDITIWRLIELENKNNCQNSSDILLPTNDILNYDIVTEYLKKQTNYTIRDTDQRPNYYCGGNNIFSSEENRIIVEREFTLAGLKINSSIHDEKKKLYWKPLGITSLKGLGFGAMVLTYRNCPNNTPLALWWGDWDNNVVWTPLFQRKTYKRMPTINIKDIFKLK